MERALRSVISLTLLLLPNGSIQISHNLNFLRDYEITRISFHFQKYNRTNTSVIETFEVLTVNFEAFQKIYHLRLFEEETLSRHFVEETKNFSTYRGFVERENRSEVIGYFRHNIFVGQIYLPDEILYLESAAHYLNDSKYEDSVLVYKESDVVYRDADSKTRFHDFYAKSNKNDVNIAESNLKDRKFCLVQLVSDYTFSESMNFDENLIKAEMIHMMKQVDNIFKHTDFDEDGKPDGIGIFIAEIFIKRNLPENISLVTNSREFLHFASLDIQMSCLSVWFCYRNFEDHVAYSYHPLESANETGGICQMPIKDEETGKWHSKNIVYVTYIHYDQRLPAPVVLAKLIHEIGHCFGSPNDPPNDPVCSPDDVHEAFGNYIMHEEFVDGIQANNQIFSLCSRRAIHNFMLRKGRCLNVSLKSVCGDGITEQDEECDCGYKEICDLIDDCCVPVDGNYSDKECTFRRSLSKRCSPHESECCNTDCKVVGREEHVTCFPENPCKKESVCNGKSETCPLAEYKTDGSPCLGTFLTCRSGECSSNPCLDHNLTMCNCSPESGEECHVCCFNEWHVCQSVSKFGFLAPNGRLFLKFPKTKCAKEKGECNSNGACMVTENPEKMWISLYWPYLVLFIVSFPVACLILLYVIKKRQSTTPNSNAITPQTSNTNPKFSYQPSYLNVESNLDQQHSTVFGRQF
ncbi:disintegrin and metalloproteinase domain-containing protein 10-like isoform X1 [Centruroides sculpturatus]|uniref:disintegrin and metalloproteinase domain-containing protein 10-like isoform X1 n=1 Tax=Centruroides sculpturatus TaxID=218467 RepID=UPI000C6CA5CD|nr:disintegrin and metalloproteinase domain-containing protein 10-like isoform X1 [Centruroides sculpturatus]